MQRELRLFGIALQNFVVGTEGNISQRTENGFLIKATGKYLVSIDYDSLVHCDNSGNPLPNQSNRPSMEASFHAVLYKMNKDIKFIAHTHPDNCLRILCGRMSTLERFARSRLFPDQVVFNGRTSCVVPYATPGVELAQKIEERVGEWGTVEFPDVILLKNHGIICCGETVEECVIKTQICEKAAGIFISSPELDPLQFDEVNKLSSDISERHRRSLVQE